MPAVPQASRCRHLIRLLARLTSDPAHRSKPVDRWRNAGRHQQKMSDAACGGGTSNPMPTARRISRSKQPSLRGHHHQRHSCDNCVRIAVRPIPLWQCIHDRHPAPPMSAYALFRQQVPQIRDSMREECAKTRDAVIRACNLRQQPHTQTRRSPLLRRIRQRASSRRASRQPITAISSSASEIVIRPTTLPAEAQYCDRRAVYGRHNG